MAPKTGNSNRPSIRNKMFAKFQRLYLYLGNLVDVRSTQPEYDQCQKSNMLSKILQKPYTGNGNNFDIEQGIFDIPTVINVFSGAPKPTERRSTQTYEDQYPEKNIVEYFRFVDCMLAFRTLVVIWNCSTYSSSVRLGIVVNIHGYSL